MAKTELNIRLLRYTLDGEELIALAAKLCYSKADMDELQRGIGAKDQSGFILKLSEMGHMSPIEHASFTFGVQGVSRSLLAQITRHRIASFSVQSQRYVGKKGDGFSYILPPAIEALGQAAVDRYAAQMDTIQGWYNEWCDALGGSGEKTFEDARFVLPNACETKMLTMNARELIHFFSLRCCNRAQWEIRALACHMLALCKRVAPTLFTGAGAGCAGGGCAEGPKSCGKAREMRELANKLTLLAEEDSTEDELFERVDKLLKEYF